MTWRCYIRNRQGFGATPVVLILVPLILLGGLFIFSYARRARAPETFVAVLQDNSSRDNLNVDSDGDGLKDWEEQIYGTNPHNPDTDGDGTNDGDEIALGRDPLKKGPNDTLTRTDTSGTTTASNANTGDQPNLTQKLAEVFGTDYLTNLVQNPDSPPDINAVANKMAQMTLDQPSFQSPPITANDIIISRNATKDGIIRYLKEFNAAILNPLKPLPDMKNISDAIANIVHTEDAARMSTAANKLAAYVDEYNQFLSDAKTISVPENFVSLHVDYLNTTVKERDALKKIQNVKNDPMMTLLGLREFMDTTTKFNDLQQQFTTLVLRQNASSTHQ